MPTQTHFICPSGATNFDLSGIFAELNGGTSYGSATNYKVGVGGPDLNALFHASTSSEDRPNFNTGFKLSNGSDLSTIFRRYGYSSVPIPVITSQPSNQYIDDNTTATFSITATGTGLSYKWQKYNGSWGDISGATSSSYSIYNSSISNEGSYRCVVTNEGGSVNSSTVSLIIKLQVSIGVVDASPPYNFNNGDGITLSATITAGQNATNYKWYRGILQYAITSGSTYNFTLSSSNDGNWKVAAENGAGYGNDSSSITINRYYQNYITSQPSNAAVIVNGTNDATFTISAQGLSSPTYQWQEYGIGWYDLSNSGRVSGVTSTTLTISNVENGDNGRQFRCVVSNLKANLSDSWSDTNSSTVTLSAYYAPTLDGSGITGQEGYNPDDIVSFIAHLSSLGSPALVTYYWYESTDGGSTWNPKQTSANTTDYSNELVVGPAESAWDGYKYKCVISNAGGSVTTAIKTLTVY